jgi:hypothetical protein
MVMAGFGILASYASVSPINMPVSAPVQVVEMQVPAASVTPISLPFESFNMAADLYDRAVNSINVEYERARVAHLAQQVQAAKEAKVFASIKPIPKPKRVFNKRVVAFAPKVVAKPVIVPAVIAQPPVLVADASGVVAECASKAGSIHCNGVGRSALSSTALTAFVEPGQSITVDGKNVTLGGSAPISLKSFFELTGSHFFAVAAEAKTQKSNSRFHSYGSNSMAERNRNYFQALKGA